MPDEKKEVEPQNHLGGVKKDDAFSRLMAGVVSDTAVMYNTYAMEATLKDSPRKDTSSVAVTVMNSPAGTETRKEAARPDSPLRSDTGTLAGREDTAKITAVPGTGVPGRVDTFRTVALSPPVPADSSRQTLSSGKEGSPIIDSTVHKGDSLAVTGLTPAAVPPLPKAGSVVKLSERKTTKGVRLVYVDHIKGRKADTIVVIIPVDTATRLAQRPAETGSAVSSQTGSDTPALAFAGIPTQIGAAAPAQKTSSAATATLRSDSAQKKTPSHSLFINSDCRNFATEYDVDKLRVKMLETGKEEDRISAAHKVFKSKCFSTKQIKALSEVFTSDAQKFRFLETAYPFVSDEHFKELSELLADPVYNSKFRTMTGQ